MALSAPTVHEVILDQVTVFKCIGDEETVSEYIEARTAVSRRSYTPTSDPNDWSAQLYTQFSLSHALGTCPYRWDQGYALSRVLSLTVPSARVLVIDAPWMPDPAVGGRAKADAVRCALRGYMKGDVGNAPIMTELAAHGFLLACRETEKQWELVFGPGALGNVGERVVMELKPGPYSTTSHFRKETEGSWRRYDERMAHEDETPPRFLFP